MHTRDAGCVDLPPMWGIILVVLTLLYVHVLPSSTHGHARGTQVVTTYQHTATNYLWKRPGGVRRVVVAAVGCNSRITLFQPPGNQIQKLSHRCVALCSHMSCGCQLPFNYSTNSDNNNSSGKYSCPPLAIQRRELSELDITVRQALTTGSFLSDVSTMQSSSDVGL